MPDDHCPRPEEARRTRRRQLGTLSLMIVIVLCGVVVCSRIIWESRDLDNVVVRDSARTLRSRDRAERISAALDLGRFGSGAPEVAVPALIGGLKDPDADVRGAAAEALGRMVSDPIAALAAAKALSNSLRDGEPVVRIASASALGTLASAKRSAGRPPLDPGLALAALAGLLGDRDAGVRSAALRALDLVGPEAGVAPPATLVAALDDPSADNRAAAATAITSFKHGLDSLIPLILRSMEHEEPRRRAEYRRALERVNSPAITAAIIPALTQALERPDPDVRYGAVSLLVVLGPDAEAAIPALIRTLTDSIDSDAAEPSGEDPARTAAWALGEVAPSTDRADEAIAALTSVLPRAGPARRNAVAYALGQFSRSAAVAIPALIDVLRQTQATDASVADGDSAAFALGQIAPGTASADEAIAALTVALDASSRYTRIVAIKSLLRFRPVSVQALPRLQRLATDPDAEIRAAAAAAVVALAPASGQTGLAPTKPEEKAEGR